MAPLHPELAQMKDRFEALLDDYDAQNIDYDTAMRTLKSLNVIDGSGAQWTLDEDGNFMRGMPGGERFPADPVGFRPAQLPMRQTVPNIPQPSMPQPGPAAWATQPAGPPVDLHTPPVGFLSQSPGAFDPMNAPLGGPNVPGYPEVPDESPTRPRGAKAGQKAVKGPKGPKINLPKRPGGATAAGSSNRQGPGLVNSIVDRVTSISPAALTQGKGRTILIAIACALVLFVGYTKLADSGEGTAGLPSTTAEAMPQDGSAPATPTGDQVNAVVSAITSGQAPLAQGVVVNPGEPISALTQVGALKSFVDNGYTISPGPAAVGPDGAVVQDWALVSNTDQTQLGNAQVTYTLVDGNWKITSWPAFAG